MKKNIKSRKQTLRLKKEVKYAIGILVAIILIGVVIAILSTKSSNTKVAKHKENKEQEIKIEKKLKIIDESSNSRPIAVMINNIGVARKVQSGVQDAYIVYELVVEGGITRMMGIYKDSDASRIGSVRSSRHYYLDYAMENDAIYVHYGWSPQAQADISSFRINNINGDPSAFWRETNLGVSSEHTAFTSMEKIRTTIDKKGYRKTSDQRTLLNYSVDEIDMSTMEGAVVANKVRIPYSSYFVDYTYDAENKVYVRSPKGDNSAVDYVTKKQITTKNIITYEVANSTIIGGGKGRQELANVGTGTGYYISNGYAIPINWSKPSRSERTTYTYNNGEELKVNDGNTFIQIRPKNKTLEIN